MSQHAAEAGQDSEPIIVASFGQKAMTAGRWIGVLPAAIASSIVLPVTVFLVSGMGRPDMFPWFGGIAAWCVCSYISGVAFVLVGAMVAPRHRFPVAVTLAAIAVFVAGGACLTSFRDQEWADLAAMTAFLVGVTQVAITMGRGDRD